MAQAPPPAEPAPQAAPPPAQPGQAPEQAQPSPAPVPAPVIVRDVGFKTPESVLHDAEQDVYFVSNINGGPTETDGNGFISKLGPDGKVVELKWIDGTKPDVTLNAPKGLAISGDKLYVTDITFVRIFDRKTGKPLGKIGAAGATFLNDIAAAPDGTLYLSDSGLKVTQKGFESSGSDAIFRIGTRGTADLLLRDPGLKGPNGLLADNEGVWVASYASNELYRVSVEGNEGKKEKVQTLPTGGLDGVAQASDGSVLVSSWEGSAVYRGKPGGTFTKVAADVKSPADIGYDGKRNVLLIPLFMSDAVQIQSLGAPPAKPAPAAQPAAQLKAQPAAQPKAQPAAQPAAAQPKAQSAAQPAAAQPAAAQPKAQGAAPPAGAQPAAKKTPQPVAKTAPAAPPKTEPAPQPAPSTPPAKK